MAYSREVAEIAVKQAQCTLRFLRKRMERVDRVGPGVSDDDRDEARHRVEWQELEVQRLQFELQKFDG